MSGNSMGFYPFGSAIYAAAQAEWHQISTISHEFYSLGHQRTGKLKRSG